MKAITVEPKKPGSARYEDAPEPDERDGSVLVEAVAVGVCGTDAEIVEGKYGWAPPGKGRLVLGIGIGDYSWEFEKMGLSCGSVRERQQALEEAVQIIRGLWGEDPFTYQGQHFRVTEARLTPPGQQPFLPLLIAGGGEKVTLRQVAQYADMANFGPSPYIGSAYNVDDVRRKLAALHQHCVAKGRPYDAILRSHATPAVVAPTHGAVSVKLERFAAHYQAVTQTTMFKGTPEEMVAYYRDLAAVGMQYYIVILHPDDEESLQLIGEQVIPALAVTSGSHQRAYGK